MKWETPEVLSYREEALMAEFAAVAVTTPVFTDLPFIDIPFLDMPED